MNDPEDAARPAESPLVLAVVGLGCIGGSIALRARSLGVRVAGYDLPGPLNVAVALGLIDEALPSLEAATASAILVLATPPEVTVTYLEELARLPLRNALVMDVASVKVPVALAGTALPNFVPTHPIAGSERSGPGAADEMMFEGRTWAIVPQGSKDAQTRALAFITAMGARVITIDAAGHDRLVATTSHLPQVLAVTLASGVAGSLEDPAGLALAGTGLGSMVRLGTSSWPLWREILQANRLGVAQDVRAFASLLGEVAALLEADDVAALESTFATAAATTRRLNGANARVALPVYRPQPPTPAVSRRADPAPAESAIP